MMHNPSPPLPRGGTPVGVLSELPAVELAAILYLRHWFSGDRAQVWRDFSNAFGRDDAAVAMASFEDLMRSVKHHARRPIMRHSLKCECFGGDECAFANFVAAASSGDEHDAMTFALHLFEGTQAKCVLGAAAMCGHAFSSLANVAAQSQAQITGQRPTHSSPTTKQ